MCFRLTFMTTGFSKLYIECAFLWMNFWNSAAAGEKEQLEGSEWGRVCEAQALLSPL